MRASIEDVETLYADLEVEAETSDQSTDQPDTPEDWDEDGWEDQLAEAREKAEISQITGTLTTKTIDDRNLLFAVARQRHDHEPGCGPVDPA